MDVELDVQITSGNGSFYEDLDACLGIFFGIHLNICVLSYFEFAPQNTVRNDGAGRPRGRARTRPAIAGELSQAEF